MHISSSKILILKKIKVWIIPRKCYYVAAQSLKVYSAQITTVLKMKFPTDAKIL